MTDQSASTQNITISPGSKEVHRIGFWSAILTTLWILAFDIAISLGVSGAPTRLVAVGASLLLAPTFVGLISCLHQSATQEKRIWSQIGLSFAIVYATLLIWNYYLQLTVVRTNPQRYDWLSMAFTRETAFWSLESIGYTLMGVAAMFCLPVLARSRVEPVIRWCFAINAVFSILGTISYVVSGDPLNVLVLISLGIWAIAFPIGTALVAVVFKNGWR